MWRRRLTNVIGFDDAPFDRARREPVAVVGAVCAGTRLDLVVRGFVQRDGDDATAVLASLARGHKLEHVRGVLLQGLTVAGFNCIDVHELAERLSLPVLVVMRRRPRFELIYRALQRVPHAEAKRAAIERAGEPEKLGSVWVQRAGLTLHEAGELLERTTLQGRIPEPLRLAHLIAGGLTTGKSRGRP